MKENVMPHASPTDCRIGQEKSRSKYGSKSARFTSAFVLTRSNDLYNFRANVSHLASPPRNWINCGHPLEIPKFERYISHIKRSVITKCKTLDTAAKFLDSTSLFEECEWWTRCALCSTDLNLNASPRGSSITFTMFPSSFHKTSRRCLRFCLYTTGITTV